MLAKVIVILVLLIILASLIQGAFYLVSDQDKSKRVAKSLTWRIGLSVVLFIFLFIAFALGWIQPHQLGA